MKAFICYLTTFFLILHLSGQHYYPGGLGNSNLIIWLNAGNSSSITKNGSNQVSQWSDLSNGYLFTQATIGNEPVYGATAAPNGRPALTFTSTSSQYLSLASLPNTISFAGGVSTFSQISFNASTTAWGWERVFDFGNGQANNNITFGRKGSTANFYYEGFTGGAGDQTYTTSNPVVNGSNNIYEVVQQPAPAGNYTNVAHYLAGVSQANSGAAGPKTWIPQAITRTKNYLGRSNWAADDYFSGTMSEVLLYNVTFNTTQRVIMENYLSAAWNQAVSVSKYTPPTTTTYTSNLVGIGYTSATDNFLTNPSGSTDGLGFSSGTSATDFLNSAGYLMAAHNAQSATTLSNVTIPGISSSSSISRWNRSWNVQKTGGNGTGAVTFKFDFSDYNGTTPSGALTYRIAYNAADGTFSSGTSWLVTSSAASISGNVVSFTVNMANMLNGYYTLVYSSSVLPVTLTGFTATRQKNSGLLEWSVAQEANADHYEIQRWTNSNDLSTIGRIAAKGNSAVPLQYSFTDSKPAGGKNFYRLRMVDKDGAAVYSSVASLDFTTASSISLSVYPNPVADRLHIVSTDGVDMISVAVVNTSGQVVRTVNPAVSNMADVSVGDLSRGIYFIEIEAGGTKYVRKIMKN